MNGSQVLEKDVDSIGWNESYIITYSKGFYRAYAQRKSLPNLKDATDREAFFRDNSIRNVTLKSIEYYESNNSGHSKD